MQEIKLKVSNRPNGLGAMDGIASVAVDTPDLGDIRQLLSIPGYLPAH